MALARAKEYVQQEERQMKPMEESVKKVDTEFVNKEPAELTKAVETDKWDLEDMINQAETEIELNSIEVIQVGSAEYMMQLQKNLDVDYKDCMQNFGE